MDKRLKRWMNISIAILTFVSIIMLAVAVFLNIKNGVDITLVFIVAGIITLISSITLSIVLIIVQREAEYDDEEEIVLITNDENK